MGLQGAVVSASSALIVDLPLGGVPSGASSDVTSNVCTALAGTCELSRDSPPPPTVRCSLASEIAGLWTPLPL